MPHLVLHLCLVDVPNIDKLSLTVALSLALCFSVFAEHVLTDLEVMPPRFGSRHQQFLLVIMPTTALSWDVTLFWDADFFFGVTPPSISGATPPTPFFGVTQPKRAAGVTSPFGVTPPSLTRKGVARRLGATGLVRCFGGVRGFNFCGVAQTNMRLTGRGGVSGGGA